MENKAPRPNSGVAHAVAAYTTWGLLPVYWKLLASVDAPQILACRIIFSLIFVWVLLALRRKPAWPKLLKDKRTLGAVSLSATLITVNWGVYIWAVNAGHTVEAALGYYMTPLVNVLLGLLFFRERLPRLQWAAFAAAALGVGLLTALSGKVPWISLILAFSFGFYGLAKKKAGLAALEALGAETLILALPALSLLLFRHGHGTGALAASPLVLAGLAGAGVVTALPLYWFALGAARLPLSSLGFIQFISPTLQLLIGVLVFREPFPVRNLSAFVLVWTALGLYTYSTLRLRVARKRDNGI